MAGHSQFANIMHRKDAQDKKRAKLFQRIIREIHVAIKLAGSNPDSNAKLRSILEKAKAVNMPKDIIKRAIDKAANQNNTSNYEAITYEGYGASGIALIVHCLTDNKNRTASNVRSYFTKCQGKLGTTNSVQYLFNQVGVIAFDSSQSLDEILEIILEFDVLNWEKQAETVVLTINPTQLTAVAKCLEAHAINNLTTNEIRNIAIEQVIVSNEQELALIHKLITLLEEDDDVLFLDHNLKL